MKNILITKNKQKMKISKYDYILSMFVSDEEWKQKMTKPFLNGEYYCATDSFSICVVPKQATAIDYEAEGVRDALKVLKEKEETFNDSITISKDFLLQQFTQLEWEYKYKECERCNGAGIETCLCCGNETDCGECDGTGQSDKTEPFSKMKLIDDKIFFIDRYFDPNHINKVLLAAYILEEDNIVVRFEKEAVKLPVLFEIKDCRILLMPI